jgi:cohesin loading factor subunit SCC2
MTSLTQLIEKDPQVIDEKTFPRLTRLILDTSPLVRENTLSLISKCLERDPSLERHCFQGVLNLMTDPANGPKKKAIKLLKDIYVSMKDKDRKVRIATEVLLPVLDEDKAVAELARQTLEDIWIARLRVASRADENQMKLKREKQISLLVDTVHSIQTRPAHQEAFESFFNTLLSPTAKNLSENIRICKQMVEDMVTSACTDSSVGHNSQLRILQTLSIFAKVSPRLFTVGQVELLKTYVKDLKTAEEVAIFRPTVVIFRHVFPVLSTLQETFLEEIRAPLTFTVARLAQQVQLSPQYKETLLDVVHCLWIISPLVKGDLQRLNSGMEKTVTLLCSVAAQLELITTSGKAAAEQKKVLSYLVMLGVFGKVFDLDEHIDIFKRRISMQTQSMITAKKATVDQLKRLTAWKNPSAAVLLLDLILPFTKQAWDINLRQQALCSIGEVCQQKTKHFTRKDIETAFKLPFINQDDKLIRVVLTQFRDFLASAERRSETGAVIKVGEGAVHGAERMQVSYAATDNDHATTHIARTFLPDLIKTALGEANDLAVFATEILVSISRQGLLHPKECGTALVALSTSLNPQISAKASSEHHKTHLQHETMFEKEYVSAVTLAFQYHRDVFHDSNGAVAAQTSFKPKMQLLFDAFKQGSRKTLKKFTSNIFRQLNFELPKLDVAGEPPEALLFARFCLENFAFFDLQRVDEVSHLLLTIESIVLKQTGPSVALAIETEMPEQSLEQPPQVQIPQDVTLGVPFELQPPIPSDATTNETLLQGPSQGSISEERLRHLTIASMILHMMWETRTFLRRAYNLNNKISPKDLQKPATRIGFVTGKDFWERISTIMSSLSSTAAMRAECREFAEIINIDGEHAVGDDEDGDAAEKLMAAAAGYETPEEDEEGRGVTPTSGRGRKRKSNAGLVGHTPKKPRARAPSAKNKGKRNSKTPEDSE